MPALGVSWLSKCKRVDSSINRFNSWKESLMHFRLTVIIFAVMMFCANSTMARRISYPEVSLNIARFLTLLAPK
jgi:hypothetical protein